MQLVISILANTQMLSTPNFIILKNTLNLNFKLIAPTNFSVF